MTNLLRPARISAVVLIVLTTLLSLSCGEPGGVGVGVGYGSRWGGGSGTPPVFVGSPGF